MLLYQILLLLPELRPLPEGKNLRLVLLNAAIVESG